MKEDEVSCLIEDKFMRRQIIAMDTKTNLTQEWLDKYESIKDKLQCKVDLDEYFTKSKVANMDVAILDLGQAHFPTGQIIACDPFVELEDCDPFIQTIAPGTYSVQLCVVPHQKYGNRYACAKLKISDAKAVRYEMAMTGKENLNEEIGEDEYFGFGVDAGMGCFADVAAKKAFKKVWESMLEEDPDIDPYNDLFDDLLCENAKLHPDYQLSHGEWLNYTVPNSETSIVMFTSGWGDGYYPVYFAYDAQGNVCAVYILFIDIAQEYND